MTIDCCLLVVIVFSHLLIPYCSGALRTTFKYQKYLKQIFEKLFAQRMSFQEHDRNVLAVRRYKDKWLIEAQ